MAYIVRLDYDRYVFYSPQDAFDFATTAKKSTCDKGLDVRIDILTLEEYKAEYEKVENNEAE